MKHRTCHELGVCHGRPGPGCTCRHDTHQLPAGGFYFAPGTVQQPARGPRRRMRWAGALLDAAIVLAIGLALGVAGGWFQVKGWL